MYITAPWAPLLYLFGVAAFADHDTAPDLPQYSGPKPPWSYQGYTSFPAHYFGANESGLQNATTLELVAKHQFAGWGWQQNYHSVGQDRWRYYQQEVSLAQMASRMAAYMEFSPPSPEKRLQALFVYRHIEVAEWYFQTSAAAYHNPMNKDMFLHDKQGNMCWDNFDDSGPYWNFSNPRVADWFVDEIGGELSREANIQGVFFDETDYLYCGGPAGNCSADVHSAEEGIAQYRAKIQVLRCLALKLDAANIWPIYSSYNGYSDIPWRNCLVPYDEYYSALHDVGWFRFYEYGFGATKADASWNSQAQFKQALRESSLGLPVIVHPYPVSNPGAGNSPITLPLALFLLAQNDYWYFGASSDWTNSWRWWEEYDGHYGKPLGPAVPTTTGLAGWQRTFEGCSVFVNEELTQATISFRNGTTLTV